MSSAQAARSEWLIELLSQASGQVPSNAACACGALAKFRCISCSRCVMLCRDCIVVAHRRTPDHIAEEWTGDFFSRVTLTELGVRVHLGHGGGACGDIEWKEFSLISTRGIFPVVAGFCRCDEAANDDRQLFKIGWLQGDGSDSDTCITCDILDAWNAILRR
ncbi:hypothetical protein C8R44DRAFT_886590 [Mycena epipterygia]|nr:hypothetical protein C8R44DRAFT_886590 [Mycena epipterygia]